LCYTVFGFLILPLIVRWVAVRQLRQQLDREATIRSVRMNPFTLSLTIRGLLVKDKDGQDLLSFEEFYANFQLSSFFGKAWVFKEIRLVQPFARARINQDYSLNCSDLIKKFSTPATNPSPPASKPVVLAVDKLSISNATADFTDLTLRKPLHRLFGPLRLSLTGLRTDPNKKNPYSFSGTTDAGEKFAWSGYFSLDPLRSGGHLSFERVVLMKNAPLIESLFQFILKDGLVGLSADYEVALNDTNWTASVSNAAFSLKSFRLGAPGQTNNFFELDFLNVGGVSVDTAARTGTIGEVSVAGARLAVSRGKDDQINLVEMSHPAEPTNKVPGGLLFLLKAATNAFVALRSSTNLWSATVERVDVTNCALNLEDLANTRPVHLTVDDIAVTARHLSNVPGSNQTAALSLRWNSNGTTRVEVTSQLLPPAADFNVAVDRLELAPLDPYLEPFLDLNLLDGKASLHGQLSMHMASNGLPEVTFKGDTGVEDFATTTKSENLVKWKSLRVNGISAKLPPPEVNVKEVALMDFDATVGMESNRTLNVMNVLRMGRTNGASAEASQTAQPQAAQAQATPPQTAAGDPPPPAETESKGMSKELGGILARLLESRKGTNGSEALKFSVDTVVLSNAAVHVYDRSIEPPVVDSLDHFSGTITGISSEEMSRAEARLAGTIGGSGPLEITGKLNPLHSHTPSEMQVSLRDVDMTVASPYTGKFVGYSVARGKLNLQMNYTIEQRQLKANNALMLDQFTFGSKVDSPDATSLPVRLAVALLKDRDGKIELDLPIDGNLDDPDFRYGKAIMQVLVKVITKIITSPFAALGALFGGSNPEEVSYQDFAPGSSELTTANLGKLDALLRGLQERPGLQVEIQGCVEPAADREALRKRKLDQAIRSDKWSGLREIEQARLKPEDVELLPEDRQAYLKKVWSAVVRTNGASAGDRPRAAAVARPASFTPLDSRSVGLMASGDVSAPVSELEQNVLTTISVSDAELTQLAADRARSVQQKLLDSEKLQAERIVLSDLPQPNPTNAATRVYFHLQ
jgi:hypothetical protein